MRNHIWLFPPLIALLFLTSAARAQEKQETPSDPSVVVIGKKQTPAKQAERFVRQLVSMDTGQLARFLEPVCPSVLGVPPAKASAIEDRLRRDAAAASVPLGGSKCEPNLVIVIAASADGFIRTMRKRHSVFFDDLSDVDLRDAFRSGPVHAWRLIEDRNEDGAPISGVAQASSSSVFALSTQAATVNAVVVFDKKVVLDKTISQIADYVAMRTLAGAHPPEQRGGPETILTLFDTDGAPPEALTSRDAALLAGLYKTSGTSHATGQLHQISREMARDPDKQPTPSN